MSVRAFDVFLSHGSDDKPAVETIARRLRQSGIRPWLDKWNLIPGTPWQPAIEEALSKCLSCAVFLGPRGTGPWQAEEMRAAIDRRVRSTNGSFRVIPVLLPGAKQTDGLPAFLVSSTWVKFEQTVEDEDAFHRLVCGVRGIEPGQSVIGVATKAPVRWVLVLDGSYDEFSKARAEAIAKHLQGLLADAHLTITRVEPGSVRVHFQGSAPGLKRMQSLYDNGQLTHLMGAEILAIFQEPLTGIREMTEPDKRALLQFAKMNYRTYGSEEFIKHVLSSVPKVIPSDVIGYHQMDPQNQQSANWFEPGDVFTPTISESWQRHMHEHPVLMYIIPGNHDHALSISDFWSESRFHQSRLYKEIYKPLHLKHDLYCFSEVQQNHLIGVTLARKYRRFSEHERRLLGLIQAHLVAGWQNAQAVAQVLGPQELPKQLSQVDKAVIVLTKAGQIKSVGDLARRYLTMYFPSVHLSGGLPHGLRIWIRQQQMNTYVVPVPFPRKPLVIDIPKGKLFIRLLSDTDQDILLLYESRDVPTESEISVSVESVEPKPLTQAEVEVLDWLTEGKTNADIASLLNVNADVVEKQLPNIFAKLGVESQVSAIRQVIDGTDFALSV